MHRPSRRAIALAIAILLIPAWPATAGDDSYRLAGVMAVGPDYLGILELPDGDQMLVRKGSAIEGGGRVVLIDATRLRIEFPGRPPLEFILDGSGTPPEVPAGLGVLREQSDRDHVMLREVDGEALEASLARSRSASGSSGAEALPATRPDPALETGRRLSPILNLPPNARVVAVNEQPVRSADRAIALIEQSLKDGIAPRLNLAGDDGESRVYVTPAQPQP